MNIVISKSDILWNYLGYGLKILSNVIILPFLISQVPSDELGFWYVFLSIGSLIQLLDLGFMPTIMRNISYAFGGATRLKKEGFDDKQVIAEEPNYKLICKLVIISKKIYFKISIGALLLLLTIGTYYIYYLTRQLSSVNIYIAWIIFCIGTFSNLYYSYWMPVLNGIGRIRESQQAIVLSQVLYLFIAIVGLLSSFGIIAMSFAFLVSGFSLRWICKHYFQKVVIGQYEQDVDPYEYKELFDVIWHTARKMGIVSAGAFLITQSNTLICSTFFGLKTTAEYGLTLQLFGVVATFASILFRSYVPIINEARVKNNQAILKKYLSISVLTGWLFFSVGSIIIIFTGNWILQIIGSKTILLNEKMLVFMAMYLFLEFNHGHIFASFIITNNEIPFVKSSIISGITVVLTSMLLVKFTDLKLWSILIAQAGTQLAYNNWKWPREVMKQMKISLFDIICLGYQEVKLLIPKNIPNTLRKKI